MIEKYLYWDVSDFPAVMMLLTAALAVPVSVFVFGRRVFAHWLARSGRPAREVAIGSVLLERGFGLVVLGGMPAAVAVALGLPTPERGYGWSLDGLGISLAAAAVGMTVVVLSLLLGLRIGSSGFDIYPEIQVTCWDHRLLAVNALAWLVYLIGFELLFRGFLLFTLDARFGAWPAIAVSTALYVYFHLPRSPQESFGSFFLGLYFGAVALATGSILCPIFVHLTLAVFAEYLAIGRRSDTTLVRRCPPETSTLKGAA